MEKNANEWLAIYRQETAGTTTDIFPHDGSDDLFPIWERYCGEKHSAGENGEPYQAIEWCGFLIREDIRGFWCDLPRAFDLLSNIAEYGGRYGTYLGQDGSDRSLGADFLIAMFQAIASGAFRLSDKQLTTLTYRAMLPFCNAVFTDPLYVIKNLPWELILEPYRQVYQSQLEKVLMHRYLHSFNHCTEFNRDSAALRRFSRGEWLPIDGHAPLVMDWLKVQAAAICEHCDTVDVQTPQLTQQDQERRFKEIIGFWKARRDRDPQKDGDDRAAAITAENINDLRWAVEWSRTKATKLVVQELLVGLKPEDDPATAHYLLLAIQVDEGLKEAVGDQDEGNHDPMGQIAQQRQAEEAERLEAQRLEEAKRLVCQTAQEAIQKRCRQVVVVFNGLFDHDVDPEAVLNGQVTGEYANIQSAPSSSDMRLEQRPLITLTLHQILEGRTWLEIEEGDDEQEMRDAFETANLLVWHELCHLVRSSAVDELLGAVALPADADEAAEAQARETVLDALAMRLGQIAYVHPPPGEGFPRTEEQRLDLMRRSLAAMARRIIRFLDKPDLEPGQREFILRLAAELQVHAADGSARAKDALQAMQETFGPLLDQGHELLDAYVALYGYVLAMAHVTSLPFRGSLDEDEQDGCGFGCAAPTIH